MKKLTSFFVLILAFVILSGCSKTEEVEEYLMEYRYSTVDELIEALIKIDSLVQVHEVMAFMDTLPNGEPNPYGEVMPLTQFVNYIFGLVEVSDLEEAIYEIYRFNGQPFSLISYLMKAQMVGNITPAVMAQILMHIPLPPIPVPNFIPPLQPIPVPVCVCDNPKVKIKVTWTYKPACGNRVDTISGYAANNTLNNMSTGLWFRLDAEMKDCKCPGGFTWTNTVSTTSTSYGYSAPPGPSVGLTSYSSGTFVVTFKGVCACNGKEATATFTITF
ncbi:MAG: hypothetical protein HQ542_08290 [Bacteroidia bacterium]|nr:hypothetical protein [Bacteroidia bacterium]